jgi:hypothetical protein
MSTKEVLGFATLTCRVEAGLFPDEATVAIKTEAGDVSFFCPREFIAGNAVKVTVLEASGEKALVRLPVESPVGKTFVVNKADLAPIATT